MTGFHNSGKSYEKCQRKKIKMMSVNQIAVFLVPHITGGLQYNETFIL